MRKGEETTGEDKFLEDRKRMKRYLTWNRMCAESQLTCAGESQKLWRIEESGFPEGRGQRRAENGRTELAKTTPSLSLCSWPYISDPKSGM